jgi:hypothetical protein
LVREEFFLSFKLDYGKLRIDKIGRQERRRGMKRRRFPNLRGEKIYFFWKFFQLNFFSIVDPCLVAKTLYSGVSMSRVDIALHMFENSEKRSEECLTPEIKHFERLFAPPEFSSNSTRKKKLAREENVDTDPRPSDSVSVSEDSSYDEDSLLWSNAEAPKKKRRRSPATGLGRIFDKETWEAYKNFLKQKLSIFFSFRPH